MDTQINTWLNTLVQEGDVETLQTYLENTPTLDGFRVEKEFPDLPQIKSKTKVLEAVILAAQHNQLDCLRVLQRHMTPMERIIVFLKAAQNHNKPMINWCARAFPEQRPAMIVQFNTWLAHNNISAAQTLLPYINHQQRLQALQSAVLDGKHTSADFLLDKCDANQVMKMLKSSGSDPTQWTWFENIIAARQQRKMLSIITTAERRSATMGKRKM